MINDVPYSAEGITDPNGLTDIRIHTGGKTWHLWGRNGLQRESDLAAQVPDNSLPVLLGAGLGHALAELAKKGPVAVVDKESAISNISHATTLVDGNDKILWLDDTAPQAIMDNLIKWQTKNGGKPFIPVVLPLYQRLDRKYYGALATTLRANARTDFWSQARYPKFESVTPRILFLDSNYFLCGEIISALKLLNVEHHILKLDGASTGNQQFIKDLLTVVIDFKPDFVLTVNHFGLDREGRLAGLFEELNLPLASWFVDNPHLILHEYAHPGTANTAIFTFDAGNLDQMRDKGFDNVHYLPLATDPNRFHPGGGNAPTQWTCDVSFVGNSMQRPVENSLRDAFLPTSLIKEYESVATQFGTSGETDVVNYLKKTRPDWFSAYKSLPSSEARLALESLLTWEATRQYRLDCVKQIIKFNPIIVGDTGWGDMLGTTGSWRHIPGLDYYDDLPRFYPASKINFNCTSRQMIGAVNQRVFDVPACGGFVLTDHRKQMESLFELGREAIVYRHPEEIPPLIREFLSDDKRRKKISQAARKRILAEHTYEIRLTRLLAIMRNTFSR